MMRCETCFHECTGFEFVTLNNLCEHLYLDSLAQKGEAYFSLLTHQSTPQSVPQEVLT